MILDKTLQTPRLSLRMMSAADASEAYLGWMRDPVVNQYLESRFSVPASTQDLVRFIEYVNASSDSLLLGIFLREDGSHIGNIKIGPVVTRHARAELGYLIGDRNAWGKGYGSEAIREVARYGIEELGMAKITAGIYETNIGSAKALLKAGFKLEATISSHVICNGRRLASQLYGLDAPVRT
ncbi:GNAT family N-acetyltransferase [Pusillimonas minor]|uniref:GNAT family N-acetyltransferase n=1 Tax=Pusillimonas minor TaxID=2697024 RepID=A0A842HTP5_9BURK|nr:GNAT family N-acetyltransferase [Pusillimonas minor]MBC2770591.1 GNAT family N-acetyltransferase [Pusillimonas minor]